MDVVVVFWNFNTQIREGKGAKKGRETDRVYDQ
jgi:hypothetical protein